MILFLYDNRIGFIAVVAFRLSFVDCGKTL